MSDVLAKLGGLLELIAFPETPEERDAAETEIKSLLATVWDEGFAEGKEECCGMGAEPNPYANFIYKACSVCFYTAPNHETGCRLAP